VTSPSFARAVLVLALAGAPFVVGCKTGRGEDGRADVLPAKEWVATHPPVGEARMANGVKVVVEENHLAPLVAIQVWVGAGAADDPPELAGAAHLYEHLVLRGGKRWGPGGGLRELEAVKGSVGAWTGLDETVYHAVVAAPFFQLGLEVLADAVANPNFDPAEVERARKLALDELAGAAADPRRRALQNVFASAFAGHAYARPVLGTDASVTALSRAALAARFAETHAGQALTVVIVGDVDGSALAAAERAFGAIPGGSKPTVVARGKVQAMDGLAVSVTAGSGSPAEIVLGFRSSDQLEAPEAAALDLWAAVLARGEGSRMQRELVRNRQLAAAVRPISFRSRDGGLWAFAVTPAPHRIAEAAAAAVAIALESRLVLAGDDEIAVARAALESDLAQAGEGPAARARRLGFASVIARDATERRRYLEAIRTAGPGELKSATRALRLEGKPALAVALPPGPPAGRDEAAEVLKPRLEAMLKAAPDRALERMTRRAPAVGPGDAVRVVTPAGIRVLALRDAAAPLVSIEAAWVDRSGAVEGVGDDAAPVIAALFDRGTRTRSATEFAAELRRLGGNARGFATPGTLGFRADFLPRHLGRGLELVADALSYPAFPESELEAEGRAVAGRRRAESQGAEAGSRAALNLFHETLWPDAARRAGADALPTPSRIGLLERYRRRYPLSRLVVAVVGDVDPAQVVAAVTSAFPGAPAASSPAAPQPAPTAAPAPPPPRQEPTTVFRAAAGAESAAVVGYPTFGPGDPNRAAIEALVEILGEDGGRLAAALGDNRPACVARARVAAPGAPGYLAVSVTCPPARLDAAVAAVRAALGRVAAEGVTPDEVTRATRRLTGARAATLRTGAAIADALVSDEALGLPMLAYRRDTAALASVAAPDVVRAARAVLDPKREVVAVVHPPSAAPALARTSGAR
jgi:zinc protease